MKKPPFFGSKLAFFTKLYRTHYNVIVFATSTDMRRIYFTFSAENAGLVGSCVGFALLWGKDRMNERDFASTFPYKKAKRVMGKKIGTIILLIETDKKWSSICPN